MQDKSKAFLLSREGKVISLVGCAGLTAYFGLSALTGAVGPAVGAVYIVACVFLLAFAYVATNPDALRSAFTEQTLATASDGLSPESAEAVCRRLLPETRAMAIAITDETTVLAYVGKYEADFPVGSPIHTPATKYVLEHGRIVERGSHDELIALRGRYYELCIGAAELS